MISDLIKPLKNLVEYIYNVEKKMHFTVEDDNSFSLPKKRNIFSSCFQYSERAIHSTERNFTSAERS